MNSATVYMAQKFILVAAAAQLQLTVLDETYFTAAMRPSISLGQRTCLDRIFRHFSNRLVVCVLTYSGGISCAVMTALARRVCITVLEYIMSIMTSGDFLGITSLVIVSH